MSSIQGDNRFRKSQCLPYRIYCNELLIKGQRNFPRAIMELTGSPSLQCTTLVNTDIPSHSISSLSISLKHKKGMLRKMK